MTKESQDDFSLQNCILNGTKNLDTIRSELQKHKFAEFKQGKCADIPRNDQEGLAWLVNIIQ